MERRRSEWNRPGRISTRRLLLVVVAASLASASIATALDEQPAEVDESFANRDFDRARWTMGNLNVAAAKADLSRGTLRLVVPAAPAMRPLLGLDSRFGLEGDFEISVDYTLRSLPRPEKEWVNVSIYIQGADGQAAMTRTNDLKSGQGYNVWFQPGAGSKAKGAGQSVPTEDKAGSLKLERVGSELRCSAAAKGQSLHQIAAVEFGTRPVQQVGFHILAPAMKAPVDVEFDNVHVKAERFTGLAPPTPAGYGVLLWVLAAGVVFIAAALVWWWRNRSIA
jgi:hypothetical protein